MEESIKRAEKLVHATNSALAQMKYNLIFDDLNGVSRSGVPKSQDRRKGRCERRRANKEDSSLEDDFNEFELDFMTEANEMLMKMDQLLEPNRFSSARKASKARDKMKEINAKLESRRLEQLKASQTEQNRQKLLDLIAQPETTPSKKAYSSKESETSKKTPVKEDSLCRGKEVSARKSEPLSGLTSRQKSKEDLKIKLRETQEIVDRGFQTARQLTQKVENMAKTTSDKKSERTPASEKTFLTEMTNARSSERIETSSELGKTSNGKKCVKCHRIKGEEREKKSKERREGSEGRNGIVDIKRQEKRRPMGGAKLKVQRLPSLHIKGGLQVQRVHNLEILPQTEECVSSRVNTAFKVISHDQIEKERTEMSLREIRRENCFCGEAEVQRNYIECFSCGKLIRIREHPAVDPREIDKLLLECNFNVFDPRIDEFVDKCKQHGTLMKLPDEERAEIDDKNVIKEKSDAVKVRENEEKERKEKMKKKKVIESMSRRFKIKELSEELSRKYKKKADELEDDHLQFENFLRDLFKKVDESREFFDSCRLLTTVEKQKDSSSIRLPQLSMTEPVIFSLVEEDQNHESGKREEKQLNDLQEVIVKEKKKKLDRKDVKNKHKSRTRIQQDLLTDEEDDENNTKLPKKHFRRKETSKKPEEEKNPPKLPPVAAQLFKEIQSSQPISQVTQDQVPSKEVKEIWPTGVNLWKSSSSEESDRNPDKEESVKTSVSEEKTENDYDSDFEAESGGPTVNNEVTQNSEEDEDYVEDREEDQAIIRCMKKLSTISEVDSELERKLSELEAKAETPEKQETNSKSEGRTDSMEIPLDCQFDDDVKVTPQTQKAETVDVRSASSSETKVSKSGKRKEKEEEEEEAAAKNVSSPKSSRSLIERQTKGSKEGSLSRESSSTEVVASLKEVLSALKDQFAKTQSLADKLTENVKELKTEREVGKPEIVKTHEEEKKDVVFDSFLMSGDLNNSLVSNLQKLRKDLNVNVGNPKSPLSILSRTSNLCFKTCEPGMRTPKSSVERKKGGSESSISEGVFSDEGPFSLGELNVNNSKGERMASDRKRKGPEKSESSSVSECSLVKLSSRKKSSRLSSGRSEHRSGRDGVLPLALGSNNDEMSYSEGEVRSDGLLDDDPSSMQSIGEVISEHISAESSLE